MDPQERIYIISIVLIVFFAVVVPLIVRSRKVKDPHPRPEHDSQVEPPDRMED